VAFWGFYFLAKFYLYLRGTLRLDFIFNFFFLLFLLLPTPGRLKNSKRFSAARFGVSVALGALLLWHDSWLPPFSETLRFVEREGIPSKEYLYRFLSGFFDPYVSFALVLLAGVSIAVRNRIRFTPVIFVLLLVVPLREAGRGEGESKGYLDRFYKTEATRRVHFPKEVKEDFDIVILHVCSLSWDDLQAAGLSDDRFFTLFDYLFDRFNSVTSYSGPSYVRLLRSGCGQQSHDALYGEVPEDCYLFDHLRGAGYTTYSAVNWPSSAYSIYSNELRVLGHLDTPIFPTGLPIQAYNYDGSQIFDDYAVLENWWNLREESGSPRAAIYYNTTSLHDGAHRIDDPEWWKKDRTQQYREFVQKLFGDFSRFFDRVASSGRNAVILFVPEHGMALRGSVLQVAGLREIPLPSITRVPVGVKLIGKGAPLGEFRQRIIAAPSSYLSLSHLLAFFMEHRTFVSDEFDPEAPLAGLPTTDFVSANQTFQIIERDGEYFLKGKGRDWIKLPPIDSSSLIRSAFLQRAGEA
jgi:hypothetical protein